VKRRGTKHAAVVFEAFFGRTFRRKIDRVLKIKAEQIAERVVVFVSGEATDDVPPTSRTPGFHCLTKRQSESVDNDLTLRPFRLCPGLLGWHLADVDQVEHFLPHVGVAAVDQVGIEFIETQIRFLLVRAVAAHAVLREERSNLGFIVARAGDGRNRYEKREETCAKGVGHFRIRLLFGRESVISEGASRSVAEAAYVLVATGARVRCAVYQNYLTISSRITRDRDQTSASVPVLSANESVSTPSFWSIVTKRFDSGSSS